MSAPDYRFLTLLIVLWAAPAPAAGLKILASIQPLALIAQEIGGAQVEVDVLLKPGQSPHDFNLKLSDRRKLAAAQLVVWVGADMEPYLEKLLHGQFALAMQSVAEPATELEHPQLAGTGGDAHLHGHDQHLWLDPRVGSRYIGLVAKNLARLLPRHEAEIQIRAGQLMARVNSLGSVSSPRPSHARSYAVAHDAYANLVDALGLPPPVVLSESAELAPGVRTLLVAGAQLQAGDCLLVDTNHHRKWVSGFASEHNLQLTDVDIMGSSEEVSDYYTLLREIRDALMGCIYTG